MIIYFVQKSFIRYICGTLFLWVYFLKLSLHYWTEVFIFDDSQLLNLFLKSWNWFYMLFAYSNVTKIFSTCFVILNFTFKFMIHLNLIVIYFTVKDWYSILGGILIFNCFQHHLLNRVSILHWLVFAPLSKISCHMLGLYFWTLILSHWSICYLYISFILHWLLPHYRNLKIR